MENKKPANFGDLNFAIGGIANREVAFEERGIPYAVNPADQLLLICLLEGPEKMVDLPVRFQPVLHLLLRRRALT